MSSGGKSDVGGEIGYVEIVADFATASLGDVDVAGLVLVMPVLVRPVLLRFVGGAQNDGANQVDIFSITDDANVLKQIGSTVAPTAATGVPIVLERRLSAAAATGKTFKIRMRVSAGTGKLFATAPSVTFFQALQL